MKDNKRLKRRVRNSYIVSTVSMALVLFLLGSVGYLMTAALRVARTLQESVTVTVELADGVDSLRRGEIERRLRGDEMVRDIEFVSKQTKIGDAEFRHMFENEIEEVLGENPLKVYRLDLADGKGGLGEVIKADKNGITVACGEGAVSFTEVQASGKKRMKTADFLNGVKVPVGTVLR